MIRSATNYYSASQYSLGKNERITPKRVRTSFNDALDPTRQFTADQCFKHGHPGQSRVEAGERSKVCAASFHKAIPAAQRQLFQRFEAIGGEAGCRHGNRSRTRLRLLR